MKERENFLSYSRQELEQIYIKGATTSPLHQTVFFPCKVEREKREEERERERGGGGKDREREGGRVGRRERERGKEREREREGGRERERERLHFTFKLYSTLLPCQEPKRQFLKSAKLVPIIIGINHQGIVRVDPKSCEVR